MTRRALVALSLAATSMLSGCAVFQAAQRPAQDISVERTPERIKRGEYLANVVMNCMECHTAADPQTHAPLFEKFGAGGKYFGPEMGLPGKITSTNLTSDPKTGLGSWTDG